MISSFIITFRETLEAALIVGIVLSYLARIHQTKYNKFVYWGCFLGVGVSIFGAVLFNKIPGGFTGRTEEIFEGITLLIGVVLLTTMILWMMKQKHITLELEQEVARDLKIAQGFGLFFWFL